MEKDELGHIIFSPSDLTRYFESEFASWMDHYQRFHSKDGSLKDVHRNPKDPLEDLLAHKGAEHEQSVKKFLAAKDETVEISRTGSRKEQSEATMTAMRKGSRFIYQAALSGNQLFGYADLLERRQGESLLGEYYYVPIDIKISAHPKPTAI